MKKYISLALALIMVFALCACSKDDSPTIDGGNAVTKAPTGSQGGVSTNLAEFKGHLMEKPMTMIASGNYMYETKTNDGGTPITYAKNGQNVLITTTVNNTPMSFVTKDGQKYIAFPSEKAYAKLTDALIKQYNITDLEEALSSVDFSFLTGSTYATSGKMDVSGTSYEYEEYYNPLTQLKYRFMFDDAGTLCYMTHLDAAGKQSDILPIKLYASSASVFEVLDTYTLADLSSAANGTSNNTSNGTPDSATQQ